MRRLVAAFLAVLILATIASANSPSADAILNRKDVRAAVETVRHETFQRGDANLQMEYVVIVRSKNSLYPLDWISGSREDAYFPWDSQIVAIVHTHLDKGFEKPSQVDIDEAVAHHTPIYVISASQIWVADSTGNTRCVSESAVI